MESILDPWRQRAEGGRVELVEEIEQEQHDQWEHGAPAGHLAQPAATPIRAHASTAARGSAAPTPGPAAAPANASGSGATLVSATNLGPTIRWRAATQRSPPARRP